jgi:hypothetical protein
MVDGFRVTSFAPIPLLEKPAEGVQLFAAEGIHAVFRLAMTLMIQISSRIRAASEVSEASESIAMQATMVAT